MVLLRCPTCTQALSVAESLSGQVVVCGHCRNFLRIPTLQSTAIRQPDSRDVPGPPPSPVTPAGIQATPSAPPPRTDPEEKVEEVEWEEVIPPAPRPQDLDEVQRISPESRSRPEPRRRRRYEDDRDEPPRRRRRRSRYANLFTELPPVLIALVIVVSLSFVSCFLAILVPPLAIVPIVLGGLIAAVGGVLFLMVAFQDDALQGVFCLIIPFYSVIYLITHFEEEKVPFMLQAGGLVLALLGWCSGGLGAGLRGW
jgi:hypothetical protein